MGQAHYDLENAMPFTFADHALVDSATVSKFVFGVDDATTDLTPALTTQQKTSIELSINSISRQIMRHVSSDIKLATYTEVWDGAASDELVPTERPIVEVTSLKFSGDGTFDNSQNLVDPGNIVCWDKYSIKLRNLRTPVGRGMVQVIYDAGYEDVPEDIQMACLLQFQWVYKQIGKGDAMTGLKTIAKGTESQTKDDQLKAWGLRSEVVGLLQGYQRFEAPLSIMFSRTS